MKKIIIIEQEFMKKYNNLESLILSSCNSFDISSTTLIIENS